MATKPWYNFTGGNGGSDGLVWSPPGELTMVALDQVRGSRDFPERKFFRASVAVDPEVGFKWLDQFIWPQMAEAIASTYAGTLEDSKAPLYGFQRNGQPIKAPPGFRFDGWSDGNYQSNPDKPPFHPGKMLIAGKRGEKRKDGTLNPRPDLYILENGEFTKWSGSPADVAAKFYAGYEAQLLLQPSVYNNTGKGFQFGLMGVFLTGKGTARSSGMPHVDVAAAAAGLGYSASTAVNPPFDTSEM